MNTAPVGENRSLAREENEGDGALKIGVCQPGALAITRDMYVQRLDMNPISDASWDIFITSWSRKPLVPSNIPHTKASNL